MSTHAYTESQLVEQPAIDDALDSGLPRAYTPDLHREKCSAVFEHVFDSYPERNAGVYAQA